MKLSILLRILIPITILILVEFFAYQTFTNWSRSLKPPFKNTITIGYIAITIFFWVFMFSFRFIRNYNDNRELKAIITIILMAFVVAKLAIASVASIDYIKRLIAWIVSLFYTTNDVPAMIENGMNRSTFIRNIAIGTGGTIFGLIMYGATNRYRYQVRSVKVPLPNLPPDLENLKIVQISDVHSGSFTSVADVQKGIDKILALKPDIIFFTGDLVNNIASEMLDYEAVFSQLKAPLGVFSILGNHDYGDYYYDRKDPAREVNLNELKAVHKRMGWDLLLNENRILQIGDTQLALIGVENIAGKGNFHSYGSLANAYNGIEHIEHKILLSHDPSHWETEVKDKYNDIQLTLSGHTHGMQFGIEIPGFIKWSPVKYMYQYWAGLYKQNNCYLHVNRGFGFLGYPGRIGILPEITELQFVNI